VKKEIPVKSLAKNGKMCYIKDMKDIAIYPGTFDPLTYGHIDLIKRALRIFTKVIVAVSSTPAKMPLFSAEERVKMIKESMLELERVEVEIFTGLVVDYVRSKGANVVIRGLRMLSDFEYEFQMAMMNYHMAPEITTIFMMPDEKYIHLNSSVLKNIVKLNGDKHG